MARYVDGFVIPLPTKSLKAYMTMAKKASKVWMDHGALQFCESAIEDGKPPFGLHFAKAIKSKPEETILFSFIVYKSRAHRDRVNAKVMKDPRLAAMMSPDSMPFNPKRMLYGGFQVMVDVS